MVQIDPMEYPKFSDYSFHAQSSPNIPVGSAGMIETLRTILDVLKHGQSLDDVISIEGSTAKLSLGEACLALSPCGLVVKTAEGYTPSAEADRWIDAGDNSYLAACLASRCKFFSGMIDVLGTPKTSGELRLIANAEYGMSWSKTSEVQRRLKWARELGLVEYREYEGCRYVRTPLGDQWVSQIEVEPKGVLEESASLNWTEPSNWAVDLAINAKQSDRSDSIGFFAGGASGFIDATAELLSIVNNGGDESEIVRFSNSSYKLSESSTKTAISALSKLGFVRRSSLTTYELTAIGDAWLSEKSAINFACCFHAAFSWVFELLPLVGHSAFDVRSIQLLLFERFNVNISHDALRKRLNVLLKAGLLKKRSQMSYQTTEHCDSFLSGYGFNLIVDSIDKQGAGPEQPVATDVDKLIGELWDASRDSGHPDRLERAVERCFSRLGFRTTLLGGSGDTDVLAVANAASRFSYSVVIDAKSTSNGGVSASQVDFDTLELHRRKHDASFIAVVGSSFSEKRICDRAKEHDVALFGISELEKLLKLQEEIPLVSQDYKILFEYSGSIDLGLLEPAIARFRRTTKLLDLVLRALLSQNEDKEFGGLISKRDVYWFMKNGTSSIEDLSISEVGEMLEFLSSPFVGCIGKDKDGYYAVGSFDDAAKRLVLLAKACNG